MFDIKELIRKDAAFIDDHCRLAEAARLLCVSDQLLLPVVNECLEPIGVVTEKDVLGWLCAGRDRDAKVADCMQTEFTTLDDSAGLIDVVYMFARENHREIPVVSDGVLAGLIKRGNLIKYLIDKKTAANRGAEKKMKCGV
jgi:predicted transcriptional regulator